MADGHHIGKRYLAVSQRHIMTKFCGWTTHRTRKNGLRPLMPGVLGHSASRCYHSAVVGTCLLPDSRAREKVEKVKEADLYSAFIEVPHIQGAQVRITQCYLQITPYLPLPRKHSPDGASQTEVTDI